MAPQIDIRNVIHESKHLIATNYVGVASYIFFIYDHLLTLSDEINYVWKGKKGLIFYLFVVNRYFFPLAFLVNIYAYLSQSFSHDMCARFVRYEGAVANIAIGIVGLMMFLRVNALYGGRCRPIQALLGSLWLVQISIYSWLLSTGRPVPHSPGIHSCSFIFGPEMGAFASLSAAAPLLFDTAVLILTLLKTTSTVWKSGFGLGSSSILLRTLREDGVLFYAVVFSANLSLTIMIATASPGLKNILGQFSQLITVTMMSRITIHLRKIGATRRTTISQPSNSTSIYKYSTATECERPMSWTPLVPPTFSTDNDTNGTGSVDSAMNAPLVMERC